MNALTFTAKDIAQGQKKRVQCVEWALYQLFCLWNPDEARNVCLSPIDSYSGLCCLLTYHGRSCSPSSHPSIKCSH
jgi:hypothetical protein